MTVLSSLERWLTVETMREQEACRGLRPQNRTMRRDHCAAGGSRRQGAGVSPRYGPVETTRRAQRAARTGAIDLTWRGVLAYRGAGLAR